MLLPAIFGHLYYFLPLCLETMIKATYANMPNMTILYVSYVLDVCSNDTTVISFFFGGNQSTKYRSYWILHTCSTHLVISHRDA